MANKKKIDKAQAWKDLDRYHNKGRFANDPANFCYSDPYYALSLKKKYGMSIEELEKAIGYN